MTLRVLALQNTIVEKNGRFCHMGKNGKEMCHDTKAEAAAMIKGMAMRKKKKKGMPTPKHSPSGYSSFRGAISGQIRTATFNDRDHVVVPVIALVEGVLHAANSESPELVLAEEFEKCPDGWNGRPVVWDHPSLNGQRVSANEPMVLERMQLGQIFNAKVVGKQLHLEAWIDVVQAKKSKEGARTLERIQSGETLEVSVGAFVDTESKFGMFGGKKFAGVWRAIVPDHLAMLPEGVPGACSVEMGCGAPRAASAGGKMTIAERFKALMERIKAMAADPGPGDSAIRQALDRALFATVPGFMGVIEVFQDAGLAVYGASPDGTIQLFRQKYSMDGDEAKLKGDPEPVQEKRSFEPVTASASADCGCGGKAKTDPAPANVEENVDKKARVLALIASLKVNGKALFEATDEAHLMTLSEERLKALEGQVAAPAEPPPAPVVAPASPKPLTEDEYLAQAPASVKAIVAEHKAASAKRRTDLVGQITTAAASKDLYTPAELEGKELSELEKIAKLATASAPKVDNSGRGLPRVEGEPDSVPKPPSAVEKIRELRAAQAKKSA